MTGRHTSAEHRSTDLDTVGGPAAHLRGGGDVLLQLRREPGQVQEHVARGAQHRRGAAEPAARLDELRGVQQVAAAVALITACILIAIIAMPQNL